MDAKKQQQVHAVRRAMVASLNKPAIDAAVAEGFDRALIEEALVLCGGDPEVMRRHWNDFWNDDAYSIGERRVSARTPFDLEAFVAHLRDAIAKEKQHAQPRRRRHRGRHR